MNRFFINLGNAAAQCLPDIDHNCFKAKEDFDNGLVGEDLLQSLVARRMLLLAALRSAGWSEDHPEFGYPVLPDISPRKQEMEEYDDENPNHQEPIYPISQWQDPIEEVPE